MVRHRSSRLDIRIPMIIAILFVIVLAFMYLPNYGFDPGAVKDYIAIIPSMLFIIVGLYISVKIGGMYSFPAITIIGFGMAIMMNTMYQGGYITVQMLSGLTISQIEYWCVIISGLAGAIVAAATSKR